MIERGILPEGTELTPINPMPDGHLRSGRRRPALGLAVGRREAPVQPDGRGVRGLLGVHRRPGGPDRRLPGGVRAAREHDRSSTAPTTAPRARAAPTARSMRTSSSTPTPTRSRRTWPWSTSWAARPPTTTTRPAGRWPSRPRSGCSSATSTRAGSAIRWSSPGRPGSRPGVRSAASTTTATDIFRRSWRLRGGDAGGGRTGTSSRRCRASRWPTPSSRRRGRPARRPSTTR